MTTIFTGRFTLALSLTLVIFSGCATHETLYSWGSYQRQVYQYFKADGSSNEDQIAVLEEFMQKARANGDALPPGYHAHLGMLYAATGKDDLVIQEFETEKILFPESSPYMDFLLRKCKK